MNPFQLTDCEDPQSFLRQPSDWIFTKGACHVLAIELYSVFEAQFPGGAGISYLPDCEHPGLAVHVVATTPSGVFDVKFGPRSEAELLDEYAYRAKGPMKPVPFFDWMTRPQIGGGRSSYLGLAAHADFLFAARVRARLFIRRHESAYGLRPNLAAVLQNDQIPQGPIGIQNLP